MTELFTAIDAGQYDPWLTLFAALILLLCTEQEAPCELWTLEKLTRGGKSDGRKKDNDGEATILRPGEDDAKNKMHKTRERRTA